MDWMVSLVSAILVMLILFFAGLPVFLTFLLINIAGVFVLLGTSGFGLLANSIYETSTSTTFAAVPLFIVMGEILFRSGAIDTPPAAVPVDLELVLLNDVSGGSCEC
jgi:TRAP-type mannitol/chloroaromatic compound transport system permease large subunit